VTIPEDRLLVNDKETERNASPVVFTLNPVECRFGEFFIDFLVRVFPIEFLAGQYSALEIIFCAFLAENNLKRHLPVYRG
jgi:hypothetical protein